MKFRLLLSGYVGLLLVSLGILQPTSTVGRFTSVILTNGPCRLIAGNVNPEGNQVGAPCDVFIRRDANGVYQKGVGTGTDTSGWALVTASAGDVVGPSSATDECLVRFDGTTGKLVQNSSVCVSDTGVITFPDGIKQIFNPNGTSAGLNVGAQAGAPSGLADGDVWYDSTGNKFKCRENGSTVDCIASGGSIQTLLDGISTTQGVILYHNGTDWVALGTGTSGHFLKTQGAGANPIWAAGAGGGNVTSTTAFGSEPGSPASGDLDLYTNSFYVSRYSGSAWAPWGPIYPMTAPVDGDFAWINQGGASVATTNGGIYLLAPAETGLNLRIRKKAAPATPYTITAAFLYNSILEVNSQTFGVLFRQSSDGKLATLRLGWDTGTSSMIADKWNSATSFSASYSSAALRARPMFLQISDDGTNRILRWSVDGQNFVQFHSVGRTDFLTADEVGFFVEERTNAYALGLTLLSWKQGS